MKRIMSLLFLFVFTLGFIAGPIQTVHASSIYDYDVLYSNFNINSVKSGPTEDFTGFTIKRDMVIKSITTYHYFNGQKPPGKIALADEKGNVYGPWQAVGRLGQGGVQNAYWDAYMNVTLRASDQTVYGVTVSDPNGWSYNDGSGGYGFIEIRGYYLDTPAQGKPLISKETMPIINPDTPVNNHAVVKITAQAKQNTSIGEIAKSNWKVALPANSFDKNTDMKITPITELAKYQQAGTTIVGPMIDITTSQGKGARLNQPATITLKLPANVKITDSNLDDYVAAYWTGVKWDYIFPKVAELKKGFVQFESFHFSPYTVLKLDEQEKVKLYVKQMATQQWASENNNQLVMENIQDSFKIAFNRMGLSDETAQGELIRAIMSENDFGSLIVSAERGDVVSYTAKCGELAANALIDKFKRGDKYLSGLVGKGAAAATGLGKGLIEVYDGNYTNAAKELVSAFVSYFPYGRAFQATKEAINKGINQWKDAEIEYAYKSYSKEVGDGVYGYIQTDDWNLLMTQMRGALVRLQQEAKRAYATEKGISIDAVYADKQLSAKLDGEVTATLKKAFERRKKNEVNIKKKEAQYTKLVQGMIKDGLLTRGQFRFDSGMDMEVRLRSLFAIRQSILGIFGGKMPTLKIGESEEANLNEAVGVWLQYGVKDRGKFYAWLEKKGYYGRSAPVEEEDPNANTPFKTGPVTPHGAGSPFDVIPGTGSSTPRK